MNESELAAALAPYVTKRDELAEEAAVASARYTEAAARVVELRHAARDLTKAEKALDRAMHRAHVANEELESMRAELTRTDSDTRTAAERRIG